MKHIIASTLLAVTALSLAACSTPGASAVSAPTHAPEERVLSTPTPVVTPTPTPTPTPTALATLAADDPARVSLDAVFGVLFADDDYEALTSQYCVMSDTMLRSAGDIFSEQYRDVTTAAFVLYIAEKCGR
jgi:hypothetical protein